MASTEVERHTGVDVEEVPSAEWGWSKENPRVIQLGGPSSFTRTRDGNAENVKPFNCWPM